MNYVFTCGDPNGIGPEIVIKTLNDAVSSKYRLIFAVPAKVFEEAAKIVKPKFGYEIVSRLSKINEIKSNVVILNIPGGKITPGKPTKISGKISYESLVKGLEILDKKIASAIITAPISKEAWNSASIKYKGHTDFLGDYYNVKHYVMMFHSKKMIAALATIHIPVKDISKKLTKERILKTVRTVHNSLTKDLGITKPEIAVLGLNPHAGENGNIGYEELKVITPAISQLGDIANGPFVPDAFFGKHLYKQYDAVVGMYHDQVLIPFKMMNFDSGVNYTAGLPVVRTSPDHGTAFDIAYKGIASHNSMSAAFKLARKIAENRERDGR